MKQFLLFFALNFIFITGVLAENVSFLEFDGDDSFFANEVSNKLDVVGSSWTIELWVYPTKVPASSTFPAIVSRKYSFELYFRNASGGLGIGIIAFDGGSTGFTIEAIKDSGSNTMSLNTWHHIAASYDGTNTRLFIDGNVVGSSTDPDFDLDASIAAINFGARYDSGYERYVQNCAMDEIRYSNTARYTGNFSITTDSPPHTTDGSTIILYHLNENSGTAIGNDDDTDFNTSLRSNPNDAAWRPWNYYAGAFLPLPIELLNFEANVRNDAIVLNWQTNAEINFDGFSIQKSSDAVNWFELGFVEGTGKQNKITSYSYKDDKPDYANYYRLKLIDLDGTFLFSEVIYIALRDMRALKVYPNPVSDFLYFSDNSHTKTDRISIFDVSGKLIKSLKKNENGLNVSNLAPGKYFLHKFSNENSSVTSFIKQ